MSRVEFSKKTRLEAWDRCGGCCQRCSARLYPGRFQFDHAIADGIGGGATLENCAVLCSACHKTKTTEDAKIIAKGKRVRYRHLGIKKRPTFPGHRKFNGEIVWNERRGR